MKRRPIVIKFPISFVDNPKLPHERKIDKKLKKLITINKLYLYEFLEIFIDHYKMYLKEGLEMPKRFNEDTKKFIKDNDPFGEWFESNPIVTNIKTDMIKSSELYKDFVEFMEDDTRGITTKLFKNMLIQKQIQHVKKKDGNYFIGIKLNKDSSEEE
jgi:putative DNA primase/helicase